MLEQRIEQDLKQALLSGDKLTASVLRGVKNSIQYAKVAAGKKAEPLGDNEVLTLLSKEAKKRQESIELYQKGGDSKRADMEIKEKTIIEQYLPEPISEEKLKEVAERIIREGDFSRMADMAKVIQAVKNETKSTADGSIIARIVKERLSS